MKMLRSEIVDVLSPGETVLMVLKQSLISDIAPDDIVVTDRNIAIIHYSFWGRYFGRNILSKTETTLVPYERIAGMLTDKGRVFTTVTVKIAGFGQSDYLKNTLGIEGLWHNDASILVSFIQGYKDEKARNTNITEVDLDEAKSIAAEHNSNFIWLGRGPKESVARLLGVEASRVVTIEPGQIGTLWATELNELNGGVLVDNYGALSPIMSRYFKRTYHIDTYVLRGGTRVLELAAAKYYKRSAIDSARAGATRWLSKPVH